MFWPAVPLFEFNVSALWLFEALAADTGFTLGPLRGLVMSTLLLIDMTVVACPEYRGFIWDWNTKE
jgi:hypothetical protein